MANTLFDVNAYVTEDALPIFTNELGITRTFASDYADYKLPLGAGVRGATASLPLPTRMRNNTTLAFDPINSGSFQERQLSVTVSSQLSQNFNITDVQSSIYKKQKIVTKNTKTAITELANAVERVNINTLLTTGYRFFGDVAVTTQQMQTVPEVDTAIAQFQSFGSPSAMAYFVAPMKAAQNIVSTAYQQFVIRRNDELSRKGEIGLLGGVENVTFMKSNFLPVKIAGTAAANARDTSNLSPGYTIVSVTPNANVGNGLESNNTSVIVLSGMTAGDTVLANDMIDIGVLNVSNPIQFLTFTGYQQSETPVQCRVITGGTVDGAGALTITVQPALIYDATNTNPYANLSRAIIPGTDTMRIAKSHRAGFLYFGDYVYFLSPELPDATPYPSGRVRDDVSSIMLRAYYGTVFGYAQQQFVHDCFIGSAGASEAVCRILFPV